MDTEAQRAAALKRANKVRVGKKRAKERLKSGELSIIEVLCNPPKTTRELRMEELLLACPHVGRVKTHMILSRAHVGPTLRLRSCSPQARERVLEELKIICPRVWRHAANGS